MANIQIHLPVDAADQLLNIVAPPQDEGAAGVWKPDAQNPALSPIQRINAMSPAPRRAFPPVGAAPEVQPSGTAPAPTAAPVNVAAPPHHGFFQRLGGVLGRIGGYGLSAVAPGIAAEIPSTPLGKIAAEHRERERELGQADIAGKQAETGEAQARTDLAKAQTEALKEPKPAAQTPEEQTIHDLMTGNNGQPRINPKTNQPYNYLDAYEAVKRAGEAPPKPEATHYVTDGDGDVIGITPGAAGQPAQASVVYKGSPKKQTEVIQRTESDGRVHNVLIDKNSGETIRDLDVSGARQGEGAPPAGNTSLSGDAYLQSLPDNEKAIVTQIGTGKMPLARLDYMLTRNPGLLEEVSIAYPDFDGAKIKSYIDTYKDFTSGPTSRALNSGGTALKHLAELQKLNTDKSRVYGTDDYNKFNNKLDTVVGELVRFYGMPDTNESREGLKSTLGALFNRDAAIREQAASMADKLASFQQTWDNAAPSKAYEAPLPGIDKEAKAALAQLLPNFGATHPAFAATGSTKATGNKSGGGVTVNAGGTTYTFPNQKAADNFKREAGIK